MEDTNENVDENVGEVENEVGNSSNNGEEQMENDNMNDIQAEEGEDVQNEGDDAEQEGEANLHLGGSEEEQSSGVQNNEEENNEVENEGEGDVEAEGEGAQGEEVGEIQNEGEGVQGEGTNEGAQGEEVGEIQNESEGEGAQGEEVGEIQNKSENEGEVQGTEEGAKGEEVGELPNEGEGVQGEEVGANGEEVAEIQNEGEGEGEGALREVIDDLNVVTNQNEHEHGHSNALSSSSSKDSNFLGDIPQQSSPSSSNREPRTKEQTLMDVKILYKHKLHILRSTYSLELLYEKYWKLLPHTLEDEITKQTFTLLFSKIFKILLPIFNYPQIDKYIDGLWLTSSKERTTLTKEMFSKSLFNLAHTWCVHINKTEYEDFLQMVYNRITKKKKITQNGTCETIYTPSIKVIIYNSLSKEDFDSNTWEVFDNPTSINPKLYATYEPNQDGDENANTNELNEGDKTPGSPNSPSNMDNNLNLLKARPYLFDENDISRYEINTNFLLYDEEVFYPQQDETESSSSSPMELGLNEYISDVLLNDDELIIFGYPTQYILSKYINELSLLNETEVNETNKYDAFFYLSDYKPYENTKVYLKIMNKTNLENFLKANTTFVLYRDIFTTNPSYSLGADFNEDELNIINNLRRNISFDRYIDMYEIKLQSPSRQVSKVNLDSLIMNSTYKKAFENIFRNATSIGKKSLLWTESIEDKIEKIYLTKFTLVYTKILNLNLNYSAFEENIEAIKDEIKSKQHQLEKESEDDLKYFDKFLSKNGIKFDNWDSDNDLYDEANKKSPVILIVGPPLIGKTSVSAKLSADLQMVYLDPDKFFKDIFKKVEEFEEKMANWDENEGNEDDNNAQDGAEGEGDNKDKPKPKKEKPGVDTALNAVEYAVYNDIINGGAISQLNMQRMYSHILHSDLALSRGVVIDMNSNIYTKNENDPESDEMCFVERILSGYYGNVVVDYVIDLTIDRAELEQRKEQMKFNMKTLKYISPREIELMKKPKVIAKEIFEDEIEYDEEGKPITPEQEPEGDVELGEEELEKIPKKDDLLEITDFNNIFNAQYDYYENTQYPKVMEYVSTLKKNYYIKVDVTGLDYDEVTNLIKTRLDFANPLRPIAHVIEGGDFKSLLTDGRDRVLPYRKWSPWKQMDPVSLKDDYLLLTGSTEFAAVYFGRVFLFINEDNRKKFLENPKKYINAPPQVPINYRISIIGPPKSGKSTIAEMLRELYGWTIIDMEEIFEKIKEYQKTWEEPELNSVYTRRVHFSANEFKEILANAAKKLSDRKPDNFISKIVFMCDYLGIPLDKKKTKEEFFAERKYHSDKLAHMFNRMKEAKEREEEDAEEERVQKEEEEKENERLEAEAKEEETLFEEMTECARSQYEIEKAKRAQVYIDHVQRKQEEKAAKLKELEIKEANNPFPPEQDYIIEDLKSDQFFLAFDNDGNQPRVSGIILINHPFNEDECAKLKEFNIVMDRIIHITDQSDEGMKALITRNNPKYDDMNEEKQAAEMEKFKADIAKYDEVITILKEKYNVNNEECVIEVGYNEPLHILKRKLINAINPFSIRVDSEEKVIQTADVPVEEKFPLSRGPFGLFCPVTYKEDNWLFYAPEANELQVNQRVYRFAGEAEMEKFKANPEVYLGEEGSMLPIDVPPPHIMITGYRGSGITFYSNVLCKEYKMLKKEIKNEFMAIWDKERLERREIRVNKKREEIAKQNEEIEQKNKDNPEGEPEPLLDPEEVIKNEAEALDQEDENYNATDNDKKIFQSLFLPNTPTIYDASWNEMGEKVQMPFADLLFETRRVPNVMVVFKVSLKTIMERHFHLDKIEEKYAQMLKESNDKRKKAEEEKLQQKREELYAQLKEQFENEQAAEAENANNNDNDNDNGDDNNNNNNDNNADNEEHNEQEEDEVDENGEPVQKKPKKMKKLPDINTLKVELEPEEKAEIWDTPDPDLPEKETLIQAEKDKLSQWLETDTNAMEEFITILKEKGIPVIEISNDGHKENVYKNLLVELSPYINNRRNLIEKQLVNSKEFPTPLKLRDIRDLNTKSEVYLQSVYGLLSPVNPHQLSIRTVNPLVYRDRVYMFNNDDERKAFIEYPLDYRTGLECPKDSYPMRGRTIIFTIGKMRSGKSTLAKLLSTYMGYKRISVKQATMDLLNKLHDCNLKREIEQKLYSGCPTDDNLIIKILDRRVTLDDMVNENIVIDGFPYILIQANCLTENLIPDFVFVSECETKVNIQKALDQPHFKGIPEVVNERFKELGGHFVDIINIFKEKQYDIRYFDMSKSRWALKDSIAEILETRKKYEMLFARNYSLSKPCLLKAFTPKKLINSIINRQFAKGALLQYSPVALKSQNLFLYNKHKNKSNNNHIVYTPFNADGDGTKFHFLSNEEEFRQFSKKADNYINYLSSVLVDNEEKVIPPKPLKAENIAEITFKVDECDPEEEQNSESDNTNGNINEDIGKDSEDNINNNNSSQLTTNLGLDVVFEYQDCCPVTIVEDKLMQKGKLVYSIYYDNKYYKFVSMSKLHKFKINPKRYIDLKIPVKKVNEEANQNQNVEKQINFNDTVNFLEFTFGSLITKGMLELSNNRIKYPYLNVKESSLKYLALFLKANNPNNNAYAKKKYTEILKEFIKNSKLPFELFSVYGKYNEEKDNVLHKKLIKKQLDTVADKYDELMEKAKIQNNTRFENFFRRNIEGGNAE